MSVQPWSFEQVGGSRKKLTLTDYAAPFGRPRQAPIFEETFKDRIKTTRYPGNSGPPTRHFFGTMWDEGFTLKGRWMDKALGGLTTAQQMVDDWQAFIRDEQRCTISWGSVCSFVGVVESLKVSWESDTEVAWQLTILVDEKQSGATRMTLPPRSPSDYIAQLDFDVLEQGKRLAALEPDLSTDLFDAIDGYLSIVASATSQLVKLTNQLNDLENQTFGTLQRLRLAIHEVQTAMQNFGATMSQMDQDSLLFSRQSQSDMKFASWRTSATADNIVDLLILADLDRSVALIQRGKAYTSYQARLGDTWEQISIRFYGGPDGVDRIRQANGVKGGDPPQPGRTYKVPSVG